MFLPGDQTMAFVTSLTKGPSAEKIKAVIQELRSLLPDKASVSAQLELIAVAVEPVQPGITDRLRNLDS